MDSVRFFEPSFIHPSPIHFVHGFRIGSFDLDPIPLSKEELGFIEFNEPQTDSETIQVKFCLPKEGTSFKTQLLTPCFIGVLEAFYQIQNEMG